MISLVLFLIGMAANADVGRKVDAGFVEFKYQASPNDPAANYGRLFGKSDDKLYYRLSSGLESFLYSSYGITQGSVLFAGSSGALSQDNANLFWDDTNNRLGIGTNTPRLGLDIGELGFRFVLDASNGNIDALASSGRGAVELVGTLPTLRGVAGGIDGKVLVIHNASGGIIIIKNEDTNPVAANRIVTGTNLDLSVENGGAVILVYSALAGRWNVIGGGGGGGGAMVVSGTRGLPNNITAVGGISFAPGTQRNKIYVQGSGGAVDITAIPQIQAGTIDGQEMLVCGRSDTNTVQLDNGTGLVLNGGALLGVDDCISLSWDTVNWVEISRNF